MGLRPVSSTGRHGPASAVLRSGELAKTPLMVRTGLESRVLAVVLAALTALLPRDAPASRRRDSGCGSRKELSVAEFGLPGQTAEWTFAPCWLVLMPLFRGEVPRPSRCLDWGLRWQTGLRLTGTERTPGCRLTEPVRAGAPGSAGARGSSW